jgi:hypothetical protein
MFGISACPPPKALPADGTTDRSPGSQDAGTREARAQETGRPAEGGVQESGVDRSGRMDTRTDEAGVNPDGKTGDAALKTPCGPALSCYAEKEICVVRPIGAHFSCKPVPPGCETVRTCACLGPIVCNGAPCLDGPIPLNVVLCGGAP